MSPLARALVLALAMLAACAPGGERTSAGTPDVLLITLDALPPEHTGFLGAPESDTPALDALAARARVLENATAPWSLPALASWACGAPAEEHGCDGRAGVLDPRFTTLAELLLDAGWDTACIVAEREATTWHGLTQGFVHVDESLAFPEVDPALARPALALADRAIRFVDQRAALPDGAPWLLWLHLAVPAAGAELRALDDGLGRVLERVREREGARGTVVVVASGSRAGDGAPRRTALVFSAPGLAPARSPEEARAVDVLPTVLALAGLPLPHGLSGRNLAP